MINATLTKETKFSDVGGYYTNEYSYKSYQFIVTFDPRTNLYEGSGHLNGGRTSCGMFPRKVFKTLKGLETYANKFFASKGVNKAELETKRQNLAQRLETLAGQITAARATGEECGAAEGSWIDALRQYETVTGQMRD